MRWNETSPFHTGLGRACIKQTALHCYHLPMSHTPERHPDFDAGKQRSEAFVQAVPRQLIDQETAIPHRLKNLNASPKVKLRQVYKLIDDIAEHRAPFVACKTACSDCCHINVSITALEAQQLAEVSGRTARSLNRSFLHDKDKFAGQACPFLVDNLCSVYSARPYACREHVSYLPTASACIPDICNKVSVPMLTFSGLRDAYLGIGKDSDRVIADIRDFFPPTQV
jgi:Fe-S-cluster containining protein